MAVEVRTAQDLYNMRNDLTADYVLMNNINLADSAYSEAFPPVGRNETSTGEGKFTGSFDGGGFTISNLRIIDDVGDIYDRYYGLFGYCRGSHIHDVIFVNPYVRISHNYAFNYAVVCGYSEDTQFEDIEIHDGYILSGLRDYNLGFICGYAIHEGNIDGAINFKNCKVYNSALDSADGEISMTGGIVGAIELYQGDINIENCELINDENIILKGGDYAFGGVVGEVYSGAGRVKISDCNIKTDMISTVSGYGVGGIVGNAYHNSETNKNIIENCNFEGKIGMTGTEYYDYYPQGIFAIGGIIATSENMIIRNSHVRGTIWAGTYGGGGVVGYAESGGTEVYDSSFEGNFGCLGYSGGIVGASENELIVERSWAVFDEWYIAGGYGLCNGGLTGITDDWQYSGDLRHIQSWKNCYARGKIIYLLSEGNTDDNFQTGGMVGLTYDDIFLAEHCYIDVEFEFHNVNLDTPDLYIGKLFGDYTVSEGLVPRLDDVYYNDDYNPELVESFTNYYYEDPEGNYYPRTTEEMTIPYASNTYLNFDWGNIWFIYEEVNEGYPVLQEIIIPEVGGIYFLAPPEVRFEAPVANVITVRSPTAEFTVRADGISKDNEIQRVVDIDEGDSKVCQTIAEKLLSVWNKEKLSITGEVFMRQDFEFKERVKMIVPEIDFEGSLPVQKVAHDVINQRTKITCGDIILSSSELLARILAEMAVR